MANHFIQGDQFEGDLGVIFFHQKQKNLS
jgi:hypothetical protein